MTATAREALIERLEVEAREAPGRYRRKVAALAVLGFVVLGGAVLLSLGVSVGLVVVLWAVSPLLLAKLLKVLWIPIAFAWMILRALWIRFDPPEGILLRPGDAPALEAEVERLRTAAGAPRLAGILLNDELNAAAVSLPRAAGLLGHRHYLLLGLPLMQALDRDQFAAVVAHEFGHFGGGDSRFAGWVYRLRSTWASIQHALAMRGGMFARAFSGFFGWYAPYFDAYSFVLARANEFGADAVSARVVGAPAAASALVRVRLGADVLANDFWPGVRRAVARQPEPPAVLQADIASRLRTPAPEDATRLDRALAEIADLRDTHPSLRERLEALGQPAAVPSPPRDSAADALLGPLLRRLEGELSARWRASVEEDWRAGHRELRADRARFDTLDAIGPHTLEERRDYARLAQVFTPERDMTPLLRDVLAEQPDDAEAHLQLGRALVERGEAAGRMHLERAMALDARFTEAACAALDAHFRRTADRQGLAWLDEVLASLHARRLRAAQQRNSVSASDDLVAAALDPQARAALRDALEGLGKVKRAWLACKQVDDPDAMHVPHFVLLIEVRWNAFAEKVATRVAEQACLPGTFHVLTPDMDRGLAKRVRKAVTNPIYVRGQDVGEGNAG